MSRILYYLLLVPAIPIATFGVARGVHGCFYLLYYVVGYRKKVVRGNLERSFPEKSAEELRGIERDFYRHLCDIIVESVRMFAMGEAEYRQRVTVVNPEFLRELEASGKSAILAGGHYNNWEMIATAIPLHTNMRVTALYSPIKDAFVEQLISGSRGKFGLGLMPKHEAKRLFEESRDKPTIFILVLTSRLLRQKIVFGQNS
ncbi:MAG: hypothetical protein R2795_19960 [Saprospiraceae bacterium]